MFVKEQRLFDKAVVISAILNKGGGGKTSLITNLAGVLMRDGARNLIIDLDAQANVTEAFGLKKSKYTSENMFHHKAATRQMITKYNDKLDVIQATEEMGSLGLDLLLSMSRYDEPFIFVKPHVDALRSEYDYILIDSPPELGLIVGNIFQCEPYILIPFVPETFAVKGLANVVRTIKKFQAEGVPVKILAVVPMFVKSNTNVHSEYIERARRYCEEQGIYMTDTVIPHSILFPNATAFYGVPATLGKDKSNEIVKRYLSLWAELNIQIKKHQAMEELSHGRA